MHFSKAITVAISMLVMSFGAAYAQKAPKDNIIDGILYPEGRTPVAIKGVVNLMIYRRKEAVVEAFKRRPLRSSKPR